MAWDQRSHLKVGELGEVKTGETLQPMWGKRKPAAPADDSPAAKAIAALTHLQHLRREAADLDRQRQSIVAEIERQISEKAAEITAARGAAITLFNELDPEIRAGVHSPAG